MPKLKTNKSAAKRFRISATGKVMHKKAGKRHLMSSKSGKRRRHLRRGGQLHSTDAADVLKMIHS